MKGILNKKYILLIFLIILFIIDAVLVINNQVGWFDNTIYNAVRSINNSFFDQYFNFFTILGNPVSIIILLVVLNIFLSRKDAIMCDILSITSVITNTIIKNIVRRDRPNVLRLVSEHGFSFPSGHSMISLTLYGYLFYISFTKIKNNKIRIITSTMLLFLIVNICISRIYVGVHYSSDVLGGVLLGLFELILIIHFNNKLNGGE